MIIKGRKIYGLFVGVLLLLLSIAGCGGGGSSGGGGDSSGSDTTPQPTGIIFEDDFDGHPDWTYDQNLGTVACKSDGNGYCPILPPNGYVGYRVAGAESCSESGKNTLNINSQEPRGGSGKSLLYWNEPCYSSSGSWGSDALLDVQLANYSQGYDELYIRYYIKFQPNWQWHNDPNLPSPMQKFLHVAHYNGTTSPYDFFAPSGNSPIFVPGLAKWNNGNADITMYLTKVPEGKAQWSTQVYFPPTGSYGGGGTDFWDTIWSLSPSGGGMMGDSNWHSWEWGLKMNSVDGAADGWLKFWQDGVLIKNETGIDWVVGKDPKTLGWNYVWLGGNNSNLYGAGEQWYAIDDLVISTSYIGP